MGAMQEVGMNGSDASHR